MITRCKFTCRSKREHISYDQTVYYDYEFSAVTGNSPENKLFWKWTPSGSLVVSTVIDGTFKLGKDYYIDLTLVEEGIGNGTTAN